MARVEMKVETSVGQQVAGWLLWIFAICFLLLGGLYFAGTMAAWLMMPGGLQWDDWAGVAISFGIALGLILMASLMAAFALVLRGRVYVAGEFLAKWSALGCARDGLFFSGVFLLLGGVVGLTMASSGMGAAFLLVGVLATGGGIVVSRIMTELVRASREKREAEQRVYEECAGGR